MMDDIDNTALLERAKYQKIWGFDQYRKTSPGERYVNEAIKKLGIKRYEKLIDYGCGTGRAAMKFLEKGVFVTGVDIADNCTDPESNRFQFINECIWDMPDNIKSDWAFCTDVLEHIPPERVRDTLDSIISRTQKGGFFSISHEPDSMGQLIDDQLHMTIRPAQWWLIQFEMLGVDAKQELIDGGAQSKIWYLRG
jgi:2-polyprenyl-3-methyl-5-hydroxy-6-metoxy-1,4-benzoquinol methylase